VAGSFVVLVKNAGERKERSMQSGNILRVVAAAPAAFVASLAWYTVFGGAMAELSGTNPSTAANAASPAWAMLFVVAQSLVVAAVLAYLVSRLGIADRRAALRLGLLVWVFPATILLGSVVHEGVPPALAAIHAGDWLTKLLLMSAMLGRWRQAASAGGIDGGHAPGRSRGLPVEVVGR